MAQNIYFFLPNQHVEDESKAVKPGKLFFYAFLKALCDFTSKKSFVNPIYIKIKTILYFSFPRTFLKELEKCTENPELLARCFLKRVSLCP